MDERTKKRLTLAAKAAGITLDGECPYGGFWVWNDDRLNHYRWDPESDDGDALRLAVKLGVADLENFYDDDADDPYAATRRAIVRAAAAIGSEISKGQKPPSEP